jgi:hypothetical protein
MLGFRVWDSEENKFVCFPKDSRYAIDVDGELVGPGNYDLFSNWTNRFIPMQSTGLTDYHGRVIYEKDILMWSFDTGPHFVVENINDLYENLLDRKNKVFVTIVRAIVLRT